MKAPAEQVVKDIRRQTRRHRRKTRSASCLMGCAATTASPSCAARRHCPEPVLHLVEEFVEAGKRRLAGDTARAATTGEVQDLRREARALKECVADLTLENRLLKKSMIADGGDDE
jgi:transposase